MNGISNLDRTISPLPNGNLRNLRNHNRILGSYRNPNPVCLVYHSLIRYGWDLYSKLTAYVVAGICSVRNHDLYNIA